MTTIFERMYRNLLRAFLSGTFLTAVMFLAISIFTNNDNALSGGEAIVVFIVIPIIVALIGFATITTIQELFNVDYNTIASGIGWITVCLLTSALPLFGLFAGIDFSDLEESIEPYIILGSIPLFFSLAYWVVLDYISFGDYV
tara:strand:- start:16686 stop:17114 length:429 start_codon:yes stop_codon:yes gene_type:complete